MRALILCLTLAACTSDKDGTEGPSGTTNPGNTDPSCVEDTECDGGEICEAEECIDGDRNNAIDEAEAVLWDDAVSGVINPAGDVDYYNFAAEGGEFIRIDTIADFETGDTAITLRDAAGKVVAKVDNYPTGGTVNTYDSVLYAWLATAGTYTVEVEDVGSFYSGSTGAGDPDYEYTLSLKTLNTNTDDPDAFDDPSYDLDPSSASSYYAVGVALEADGDADFVDLSFPWDDAAIYFTGAADPGNSEANPRVSLYTRDGQLLMQKDKVGLEGYAMYPAMQDERYVVQLDDADSGGGDDYWFFIFVLIEGEGGAYPAEAEPNDDAGSETTLPQEERATDSGAVYTIAYGQGALDPAGDVDRWSFDGLADGRLVVCMNSSIYGSTVAPTIEIYDDAGDLVETAVGDDGARDGNTVIENLDVDDGTYTMLIKSPDDEIGGPDAWYRYLLYVASFDVDSYSCP